jgi:hypothetical protein
MEIQGTSVPGQLRIVDRNLEIGFIDGTTIGFNGFATRSDAARAAWEAYRGLEVYRSGVRPIATHNTQVSIELGDTPHVFVEDRGRIARLIPPGDQPGSLNAWGFAVELSPGAQADMRFHHAEVYLRARARRMWRAIRRAGLEARMHQYGSHDVTIRQGDNDVINSNRNDSREGTLNPTHQATAETAAGRIGAGTPVVDGDGRARMAEPTRWIGNDPIGGLLADVFDAESGARSA